MWGFIFLALGVLARSCESAGVGAARLLCYAEDVQLDSVPECTHLVYTGVHRGDKLESVLKEFKKLNPRTKVLLRVNDAVDDLTALPKSKYIQGLEIYNAHQTLNKTKVQDTMESARAALSKLGGGPLFLSLPGHAELLAKYYDLRSLVKVVDLMVMETHDLGKMNKMTYHPSRLSGLWDMMNTDSVVDLAIGLGVPASKIVITLPATALSFSLQNQTLSTPGSPTDEDQPQEIDQKALCELLQSGGWTLERDQDLSAPYAFKNKTWIAFEDASSIDVKGKYARVRGLAGLALQQAHRDVKTGCGPTLRLALGKVLNQQSRAPRAAVLRSLEQEILAAPINALSLEALHLSPYRITQVVDSDGVIHSIREDTRTEFSCTRQGYFVHPRSCGRFYRCVKFDQQSPDYTVFEFDCPSGLAFDSRYEVCVWPGSLPHSQACPGSSEIAPVPRTRFHCPQHEGYYADPENCRWFFACLDHGSAELSAYEFRCPFGLGFDAARLTCDWPWLVPACGDIAKYEADAFRLSHAKLSGAQGFHGLTADAVNIAGHHSLSSGAAFNNLVGIQGGFLTNEDSLDNNFILSQELANQDRSHHALIGQDALVGSSQLGSFIPVSQEKQYTSGSLLLDDYRLPSKGKDVVKANLVHNTGIAYNEANAFSAVINSGRFEANSNYNSDNSGAYIHDPSGDYAEPYRHLDSPVEPYIHDDLGYKHEYQDYGLYTDNEGKYVDDNSGKYIHNSPGQYSENAKVYNDYSNAYKGFVHTDKSGSYNANANDAGRYIAGIYQTGNSGLYVNGQYGSSNKQEYITDDKIYTGASHALTAGAVNVGLVGKTSLLNTEYVAQDSNNNAKVGYNVHHQTGQVYQQNYVVPQPAVAISHAGTDFNNHDGFDYATTPTSSGIPTTAIPFASTTALPIITTYKTTIVPEPPKSSVTEIFGYSQPSVTYVQQAAIAVAPKENYYASNNQQQYVTKNFATYGYNQRSEIKSESAGYDYSRPSIKFEDGITYSTPSTVQVSSYQPTGFSHNTVHKSESNGYEYLTPVQEEPFKKIVAYTTGPSYSQPTEATVKSETYNHQIVHNVERVSYESANANDGYTQVEYAYEQPKTVVTYPAPQQTFVSTTPQPHIYTQDAVHKVDVSRVGTNSEDSGYVYKKPAIQFVEAPRQTLHVTTEKSIAISPQYQYEQTIQQNLNQNYGLEYSNPISYEASPKPVEPEYKSYGQQTIHKVENQNNGYKYVQPAVTYHESPTPIVQVSTIQPPVVVPEYKSHSQQIVHKTEAQNSYQYVQPIKNEYVQPIKYEYIETQNPVQYSTIQPPVVNPEHNTYSQQTVHVTNQNSGYKYDVPKQVLYQQPIVQTQAETKGYEYPRPSLQFVEIPKPAVPVQQYSTVSPPAIIPDRYSQKSEHKVLHVYQPVTATPTPEVIYQKPAVTLYENPIQKDTQKQTTTTYVQPSTILHTESFPVVQKQEYNQQSVEHKTHVDHANQNLFIYNQPEIQANIETVSTANGYSQANEVSHQVYHQYNRVPQYVNTVPSAETYKTEYYASPKTYNTPINQETVIHQTPDQFDYKGVEYGQQYELSHNSLSNHQVSFSTNHEAPKKVESFHISSFAGTTASPLYTPEIQIGDKAEEYSNSGEPSYSSNGYQISTSHVYSSTPANIPEKTENTYLPPSTAAPIVKINFKTPEYLPPVSTTYASTTSKPIVNIEYQAKEYVPRFESTYLPPSTTAAPAVEYTTREYLPPKTEKTYLPPSSTTEATVAFTSQEYLPPRTENTYLPPKTTAEPAVVYTTREYLPPSTTYRPKTSTTAKTTTYKYVEATPEYKAPEYLPPDEDEASQVVNFESFGIRNNEYTEDSKLRYNPYDEKVQSSTGRIPVQRKQNIVVETAKSNLLGFGTVGPDAGLVYESGYSSTTSTPSTEYYSVTPNSVSSTITEEYKPRVPARRVKPKVAVVTKINDFNPFLVRKLGAVCSCQQPIVVLRGRRPSAKAVAIEYDDDYDYSNREDLEFVKKSQRSRRPNKIQSVTTVTTSTFNPIIVPDDSYYQDYEEYHESIRTRVSENYENSPPIQSTTERVVQIRPRSKAVSVAPSYKTVLIEASSTPAPVSSDSPRYVASVDHSFDRFGSGGWRSRDETLQGTIDCQRAGLFRHPKQCNKFYACRWDKTKLRFTLHVFNCPIQLSFDPNLGACNWPSQGPSCQGDKLITNNV